MSRDPTPVPVLVAGYLRHYATQAEADSWAFDEVTDRILDGTDPESAWELVRALIAAADEAALDYVGAGPLEEVVRKHAVQLIDRIEAAAKRDPKFGACLGRIWLAESDLPAAVCARVVRASGGRIQLLSSDANDV